VRQVLVEHVKVWYEDGGTIELLTELGVFFVSSVGIGGVEE
jgi:hypothetical protein